MGPKDSYILFVALLSLTIVLVAAGAWLAPKKRGAEKVMTLGATLMLGGLFCQVPLFFDGSQALGMVGLVPGVFGGLFFVCGFLALRLAHRREDGRAESTMAVVSEGGGPASENKTTEAGGE